jgi:Carboxypeptidase regulatory-like domain
MRHRGNILRVLGVSALLLLAAAAHAADMTRLNIVVKSQSGKPIDRASVVIRFIEGRSIVKLGKSIRTTYEMRTNQEGEVKMPEIPQGKIRIQVIAKGYQTYGEIHEVNEPEKTLELKLNPPQQQYSSHQ